MQTMRVGNSLYVIIPSQCGKLFTIALLGVVSLVCCLLRFTGRVNCQGYIACRLPPHKLCDTGTHTANTCNTHQAVDEHDEVVDEALSVEEVVGAEQEPPAERAEPGQSVYAVHGVTDADDLRETLDLHDQRLQGGGETRRQSGNSCY